MNVVEALVAHHVTLRTLYHDAETNPAVFETFIQHLVVHHTMEEKYFYDLLVNIEQAEHDALEAVNEHHIIEMILKDAEGFPRDHQYFPIKIEGLGEYTVHHLDEEEQEIFPLAYQLFGADELLTLGTLFEQAKSALLGVALPELPKMLAAKYAGSESIAGPAMGITNAGGGVRTAIGLGIGSLKK